MTAQEIQKAGDYANVCGRTAHPTSRSRSGWLLPRGCVLELRHRRGTPCTAYLRLTVYGQKRTARRRADERDRQPSSTDAEPPRVVGDGIDLALC